MQIKNQQLFNELQNKNIIMANGSFNPRYKIQIKKYFPEFFSETTNIRELLFLEIFDFNSAKCAICQNPIPFKNPNFKNPDTYYHSNVCSKECQYKYVSSFMREFRKTNEKSRVSKFKENVSIISENGLSKASNIAIKSAKTKSNTIIDGKTIIEIQTEKALKTKISKGLTIDPGLRTPFDRYRRKIHNLSKKQPIHILDNHNLRGHYDTNGYHLDHIVSIIDGFNNGVPEEVIASIVNLRFIPAKENTTKSGKSHMQLATLFLRYFEYNFLSIDFNKLSNY